MTPGKFLYHAFPKIRACLLLDIASQPTVPVIVATN